MDLDHLHQRRSDELCLAGLASAAARAVHEQFAAADAAGIAGTKQGGDEARAAA